MSTTAQPSQHGRAFVRVTPVGPADVIDLWLPPDLDSGEFDRLNDALVQAVPLGSAGRWVLDLSAVEYMGSSILGMMVNIRQHVKTTGGQLILCGLSPRLTQIFHTCCLEKLFTIASGRDEALRQLGGK